MDALVSVFDFLRGTFLKGYETIEEVVKGVGNAIMVGDDSAIGVVLCGGTEFFGEDSVGLGCVVSV